MTRSLISIDTEDSSGPTGADTELKSYIVHAARRFPAIKGVCGVKLRKIGNGLRVNLRCEFDPKLNAKGASEFSHKLEETTEKAYPDLARIVLVKEPD
jgi:divalent metal cation (Fe/Co/Zn/Cd) transporter